MSDKKKSRGYFEKILAMDCETSGLAFNQDDPSKEANGKCYQSVSWGFIVADAVTLKPIEKLYLEIKWNGASLWNAKAQAVHGLSKEYLEENGMSEEEAVAAIANLVVKYWGPTGCICTLGHNVATFDLWFLKRLMRSQGIELHFGNRHVDTFSAGFTTLGIFNSDELFEQCGLPERKLHNSLEDIEYTLESARRIRLLINTALEG